MFNERLKELRENKKISQAKLAKILDVAASTVSMWEAGNRNPDYFMLNKIAHFFNVSIDYLLLEEYEDNNETDTMIGLKIKEARKAKDMSQKDLATKIGLTIHAIKKYENGTRQPRIEVINKISNVLGANLLNIYVNELSLSEQIEKEYGKGVYSLISLYNQLELTDQDEVIRLMNQRLKPKKKRDLNKNIQSLNILLVRNKGSNSFITIERSLESLGHSLKVHPETIDDDMLISLYHAIKHEVYDEILSANQVVSWTEAAITGHGTAYPVSAISDLLDDSHEWIDLDTEKQKEIVARNIKKILNNLEEKKC